MEVPEGTFNQKKALAGAFSLIVTALNKTEEDLPFQVCRVWRLTVIRLRWLRLVSWERKLHLRSHLLHPCYLSPH